MDNDTRKVIVRPVRTVIVGALALAVAGVALFFVYLSGDLSQGTQVAVGIGFVVLAALGFSVTIARAVAMPESILYSSVVRWRLKPAEVDSIEVRRGAGPAGPAALLVVHRGGRRPPLTMRALARPLSDAGTAEQNRNAERLGRVLGVDVARLTPLE